MALINRAGQEVSAKVVYYGAGLSGKTTNLELLFEKVPEDHRGKMISMKTRSDRTLFFDLLPLNADSIGDFSVRIMLYTVPGQVYYNATRRLVLKGVDALVFVADSDPEKMAENLESLENLHSNLKDMGLRLEDLPFVIQYNKRDLPNALSMEEMDRQLNPGDAPRFPASAAKGEGVHETLAAVAERLRPKLAALIDEEKGASAQQPRQEHREPAPGSTEASTELEPRIPDPAPSVESRKPDSAPDRDTADPDEPVLNLDDIPDPLVVEMPLKGDRRREARGEGIFPVDAKPATPDLPGHSDDRPEPADPLSEDDPDSEPGAKDLAPIPADSGYDGDRSPGAPGPSAGLPPESPLGAPIPRIPEISEEGSAPEKTAHGHEAKSSGDDDSRPSVEILADELVLHLSRRMLAKGELRLRIVLDPEGEDVPLEPVPELSRKL